MFTIKELASAMSKPTLTSLQRLRKLVGYMKHVGDIGVKLTMPVGGQGKFFNDGEHFCVLETYSGADWSSNKAHRRSTSCGLHFPNNSFLYGSSMKQQDPEDNLIVFMRERVAQFGEFNVRWTFHHCLCGVCLGGESHTCPIHRQQQCQTASKPSRLWKSEALVWESSMGSTNGWQQSGCPQATSNGGEAMPLWEPKMNALFPNTTKVCS